MKELRELLSRTRMPCNLLPACPKPKLTAVSSALSKGDAEGVLARLCHRESIPNRESITRTQNRSRIGDNWRSRIMD